jgi:hypothetical protein
MLDDMKIMMEAAYYGTSFESVKAGAVKELAPKARTRKAKA